ncbi:hypothetical protein DFA_12063 [Cavenderia fasciculata]|uniref:Uncharacterized protein n=1 Tax=Cavenderia fasciculata TaxID=261658 RepID=F4QFJ2_CACFS|nr:uncharacterized protein DFA_12063 [Cavenderia fasciculata]EGG14293.1 hypothetical protein DFA_12063 [Cavenderia fasciculata]|eukprot:XP_004351002.1 hypothetical protein DFA_12063 [Cavenderia fasciculata]
MSQELIELLKEKHGFDDNNHNIKYIIENDIYPNDVREKNDMELHDNGNGFTKAVCSTLKYDYLVQKKHLSISDQISKAISDQISKGISDQISKAISDQIQQQIDEQFDKYFDQELEQVNYTSDVDDDDDDDIQDTKTKKIRSKHQRN